MKSVAYKQIHKFLKSTEATASAFSSIGWDVERDHGSHAFWCVVNYGILEEMELDIVVHEDDTWFAELYIPPVLPRYEQEAARLCEEIQRLYPPIAAAVDTDRAVLLGAVGTADTLDTLGSLWQAFGNPAVYEAVLYMCGMSAPTEDDAAPYDLPDDPFDEN